jgi:cbb3-type cytochrome oxidase subunit 3
MFDQLHKQRLSAIAFIIIALIFLTTQNSTPFIFLFPMLLFMLVVSWFLYSEIRKADEETLKQSILYMKEEQEAQVWLHKSFVPKARKLAKKELRTIILISGAILLSFIFLWSFFVEGLFTALINTLIGFLFFAGFIIYTLYAPKEFTHLFKHVPRRFRHHSKNDWVHGYLLLLPFALLVFFLYSLTTTGEGIVVSFSATVIFLFSYTIFYISLYCLWYLYKEYQKETEESLKKTAKEILKEHHS